MQDTHATNTAQQQLRSGLLLATAGTALFALKSIFIKLAYAEGVDTTTLLTLRMVLSLPFYFGILLWLVLKEKKPLPRGNALYAIFGLGFIGYYFSSYLDMEALNYISAQLERLTLYSYPIMTTLLGWLFLKEVITRKIFLSLLLTYSGVMLLYGYEADSTGHDATKGVLMVAAAALMFSCYVVFSKSLITKVGSRLFTSIAMLSSTLYTLIHFSITHQWADLNVSTSIWAYAILLAIFSTVLPSFMISEAIARIGPAKTSIVGTAGPVFTVMLAVIFLGEPFGSLHFVGMALVMLGVALLGKR